MEKTLMIRHEQGLHARPASMFVSTANKFQATITVQNLTTGGPPGNAKSILRILGMGVKCGHTVKIVAEGPDSVQAIASLSELVESNFGEDSPDAEEDDLTASRIILDNVNGN